MFSRRRETHEVRFFVLNLEVGSGEVGDALKGAGVLLQVCNFSVGGSIKRMGTQSFVMASRGCGFRMSGVCCNV